jgi:hypothetical protein
MCKEMLVIPVNRVVDKKRIIGKMEEQGGGEAQRVNDPKKQVHRFSVHRPRHHVHADALRAMLRRRRILSGSEISEKVESNTFDISLAIAIGKQCFSVELLKIKLI